MEEDINELDHANIEEEVFAAEVKLLYKNLLVSVLANFICASLVVFGLFQAPGNTLIWSWYGCVSVVSLFRIILLYFYHHHEKNYFPYRTLFIFFVILSAALWGIIGSFLMPTDEPLQQMIIIVIIAGVTAGGMQTLNVNLTASLLYISLIIIPVCAWLFLQNTLTYFILGIAMTMYLIFMLITSVRGHNLSKKEMKLYYENFLLIKKISSSHKKLMRSYETLEQHENEIMILGKMNVMLQNCQESNEAYEIIQFTAKELFSRFNGCLAILNSSTNTLEIVKQWGDSQNVKSIFKSSDCWAIREGHSYLVRDTSKDIICYHFDSSPGAYICLPLILQSGIMGLLVIHSPNKEIFENYNQQIASNFCGIIQPSLANIKLREELYEKAIRDPLTGLYNRRFMDETLSRELQRTFRDGKSLCVAMLDLDLFKRFNDANGHEAGDEILKFVGTVLRNNFRANDIACRFGGEEFIVILTDSDLSAAYPRLETIRKEIKNGKVFFNKKQLPTLTISIGIAEAPRHGTSAKDIIDAADKALYIAKQTGRDRVKLLNNDAADEPPLE